MRLPRAFLLAIALGCALPAVAAENERDARREIERITKKLNDLSAWFSDAEKTQRDWQKELKRTDEAIAGTGRVTDRKRIVSRFRALADDPRPARAEKLSGEDKYRVRQGNYRVLYEIIERRDHRHGCQDWS